MRIRQIPRAGVIRGRYLPTVMLLAIATSRSDDRRGVRSYGVAVRAVAALAVVLRLAGCATTSSPGQLGIAMAYTIPTLPPTFTIMAVATAEYALAALVAHRRRHREQRGTTRSSAAATTAHPTRATS